MATRSQIEHKITRIKTRLGEMKEYKRILASEGLTPDADDKIKETELIRLLLNLEKQIGLGKKPWIVAPPKPKMPRTKAKPAVGRRARGNG